MRTLKIPRYIINDCEFNLGRMEIRTIEEALNRAVCFEEAADLLGVNQKTLQTKIIHYKLKHLYHKMINGHNKVEIAKLISNGN